jgi:hypothetical protein
MREDAWYPLNEPERRPADVTGPVFWTEPDERRRRGIGHGQPEDQIRVADRRGRPAAPEGRRPDTGQSKEPEVSICFRISPA